MLLGEGVLSLAALIAVIPWYGILGAAWVSACLMVANRGLVTPVLLRRALEMKWTRYIGSAYLPALGAAAPVLALAHLLKRTILPGTIVWQLLAACAVIEAAYLGSALLFCVPAGTPVAAGARHQRAAAAGSIAGNKSAREPLFRSR
jgi:hypothetical protein